MKKKINNLNQIKSHHVVISEINYYRLKSLGKMGDTFDNVLGKLLLKNQMLESDSRVEAREKTLTSSYTPFFEGSDKQ